MFNRTHLLTLLIALAAACGLAVGIHVFLPKSAPTAPLRAVTLLPDPREIPPFSLRQSDRTELVPGELRGHWTVAFLGFTSCPDICPTTLAQLSVAQKRWESMPDAIRPRVLLISVDPERDSIETLGEYAHAFHKDTLAATADLPTLKKFTNSFGLQLKELFTKVPLGGNDDPENYTIDHFSGLILIDPQGRVAAIVLPPFDPNAIAEDLIALDKAGR